MRHCRDRGIVHPKTTLQTNGATQQGLRLAVPRAYLDKPNFNRRHHPKATIPSPFGHLLVLQPNGLSIGYRRDDQQMEGNMKINEPQPFQWDEPNHEYGAFHWGRREKADNPRSDILFVYIHGILGDCIETWGELPAMIKSTMGIECDIFSYSYPAGVYQKASITSAASELEVPLQQLLPTYRHVVFITHSTGGLVLKSLLNTDIERTLSALKNPEINVHNITALCLKTRRIINIAVPHMGGKRWLTLATRLAYGALYPLMYPLFRLLSIFLPARANFGRNDIIGELAWRSEHLLQMERRYLANIAALENADLPRPVSVEVLATADAAIEEYEKIESLDTDSAAIAVRSDAYTLTLRGTHGSVKKPRKSKYPMIASVVASELAEYHDPHACALASAVVLRAYQIDRANTVRSLLGEESSGSGPDYRAGSQRAVAAYLKRLINSPADEPRQLVVKGDAGVGKSVAAGRIVRSLALQYLMKKSGSTLPIGMLLQQVTLNAGESDLITGKTGDEIALWDVLATNWVERASELIIGDIRPIPSPGPARHERTGISRQWLNSRLLQYPTLLLLDGVDEFLANHPTIRVDDFGRMLSTMRRIYQSNSRLRILLCIRSSLPGLEALADVEQDIFEILPMTPEQLLRNFPDASVLLTLERQSGNGGAGSRADDLASFVRTPLIASRIGRRAANVMDSDALNRSQITEWALKTIVEKSRIVAFPPMERGTTQTTDVWLDVLMLIAWRYFVSFKGEESVDALMADIKVMDRTWTEHLNQLGEPEEAHIRQAFQLLSNRTTLSMVLTRTIFLPTRRSMFRFEHRVWMDYLASRYLAYCVRLKFPNDLGHRAFTAEMFRQAGEQLKDDGTIAEAVIAFHNTSVRDNNFYIIGNLMAILNNSVAPLPISIINDRIIANISAFPPVGQHVVLAGLAYRGLRNLDDDLWASSLRRIVEPVLREFARRSPASPANRVTRSLAWCYLRAYESKFGSPPTDTEWPCLWGEEDGSEDALKFVGTRSASGEYTYDARQRSLQLAFAWDIPGVLELPHRAIIATHYAYILTAAFRKGCCDPHVAREIRELMNSDRCVASIAGYSLVPVLTEIWEYCERHVRQPNRE
jgi:hypothetical protein